MLIRSLISLGKRERTPKILKRGARAFFAGTTLTVLVIAGGRLSVHYLNQRAAKADSVNAAFGACVHHFYAMHPDRTAPDGVGMSLNEAAAKTDYRGVRIPCQFDAARAAIASASTDREYSKRINYWFPRVVVALLVLFTVRWIWHFLLRRIAELGAAFRGKPH